MSDFLSQSMNTVDCTLFSKAMEELLLLDAGMDEDDMLLYMMRDGGAERHR